MKSRGKKHSMELEQRKKLPRTRRREQQGER
jgi:hypothetical protein